MNILIEKLFKLYIDYGQESKVNNKGSVAIHAALFLFTMVVLYCIAVLTSKPVGIYLAHKFIEYAG